MKEENIKVIQYMLIILLLNLPVMWLVAGYMATTYIITSSIIGYICINGNELRKFFLHYSQKHHGNREDDSKRDSMAEDIDKNKEEGCGISSNRRD